MDKTNIDNELIEVITPVRLGAYGNGDNSILLNEYVYNLKLSESFYPALSLLEIALRNQICDAIDKFICKDWLLQELSKQSILADKEYQKLLESANKIKKAGKKITNDRLISEMTFGFQIHLFTKSYRPKLWDKKGVFEAVFPNYVQKGTLTGYTKTYSNGKTDVYNSKGQKQYTYKRSSNGTVTKYSKTGKKLGTYK